MWATGNWTRGNAIAVAACLLWNTKQDLNGDFMISGNCLLSYEKDQIFDIRNYFISEIYFLIAERTWISCIKHRKHFLMSKNHFLISENRDNFKFRKFILWYQKPIFWYPKMSIQVLCVAIQWELSLPAWGANQWQTGDRRGCGDPRGLKQQQRHWHYTDVTRASWRPK